MQQSKIINVIDIGSSKITVLVGQYLTSEEKMNIIASVVSKADGFRKGQIINLEQAIDTLTDVVESAERMAGASINQAHVSICAPHIESINSQGVVAISNPQNEISSTDVQRAIEAAQAVTLPSGKEVLHVIPRKFMVDGQDGIIDPVNMTGIRLEVETHIIFASSPAIKNLKKCLDHIGIKIQSLSYSGIPTAKIGLTETEKELGVALVDVGGQTTSLTVYNQSSPCFSTVIPVGGNNITNDLAIGLRLSIDEAEKLKIFLDNTDDNKFTDEVDLLAKQISPTKRKVSVQTAVNGIIKPRLEEIFGLIKEQLDQNNLTDTIPAGIVLTGGGCMTINSLDIASKVINLPVRVSSPQNVGGLIDDINTPSYTTAIGMLFDNLNTSTIKTGQKSSQKFTSLFTKFKDIIKPLLP